MDGRTTAYQLAKYILPAQAGRERQQQHGWETLKKRHVQAITQTDALDVSCNVSSISMNEIIGAVKSITFFIIFIFDN